LAKARDDLRRSSQLDSKNPFTAIWLDIVDKRGDMSTQPASAQTQFDMDKWPAPLIRLYRGAAETPGEVLVAAESADAHLKKHQLCQAYFYIGKLELLRGNRNDGTRSLQSAATQCPKDVIELAAARAELKALGAEP